jgi:hypothetical protein
MIYSGIGSQETPKHIIEIIKQIGSEFAKQGYMLRSGGADGADTAFEEGCDLFNGNKEIFIPWKGFNNSKSNLYNIPREAFAIAKEFHPNWAACSDGAKKLHTRNVMQVLGTNLKTKTDFVVCWTKLDIRNQGGTGQALRIAKFYKIDIFNLNQFNKENTFEDIQKELLIFTNKIEEKKDKKDILIENVNLMK